MGRDDSRDLRAIGSPTSGGGFPADFDAPADIIELVIGEDAAHLSFRLYHRGYPTETNQASEAVPMAVQCSIGFFTASDPDTSYSLSMSTEGVFDGGDYMYLGFLYVWNNGTSNFPPIEVALIDGQYVEAVVPKALIKDAGGGPVERGERIQIEYIICSRSAANFPSLWDTADGPFEDFVILQGAGELLVQGFWDPPVEAATRPWPVGIPRDLGFVVTNLEAGPILVYVEAEIRNATGSADGWSVFHTPTVRVPAFASLRVTLSVEAAPEAKDASLFLRLTPRETNATVQIGLQLTPVHPLDEKMPRLHLTRGTRSADQGGDERFRLLTRSDAMRSEENGIPLPVSGNGVWGQMQHGVALPWAFTGEPWALEVPSLGDPSHPAEYRFEARVVDGQARDATQGEPLAAGTARTLPGEAGLRAVLEPVGNRRGLGPGEVIMLVITQERTTVNPELVDWASTGAVLTVPVVPAERWEGQDLRDEAAAAVSPAGHRDWRLTARPGSMGAFGVWVTNVGAKAGDFTTELELPEGWRAVADTGGSLRLDPGEVGHVCIRLQVPDAATDARLPLAVGASGGNSVTETLLADVHDDAEILPDCPLVGDRRPRATTATPAAPVLALISLLGVAGAWWRRER